MSKCARVIVPENTQKQAQWNMQARTREFGKSGKNRRKMHTWLQMQTNAEQETNRLCVANG